MARDKQFEAKDKAATICLGTPALIGAIMIALALGSPGSAPYRSRATIIPVAIGLLALGGIGGGAYVAWRLRKQREMALASRAEVGAIRLMPDQRTPNMIEISFSLADHFVLPAGSCSIPTQPGPITALQICTSVYAGIQKLEAKGQMSFDPSAIALAARLVTKSTGAPPEEINLTSDLNKLVPYHARRKLWKSIRQDGIPLPTLTVPKWALSMVYLLSVAITFAITIPLVLWMNQEVPINMADTSQRILGRLIVRGGFFVLLVISAAGLTLLFRLLIPTFPASCRTIGHLAAYLPSDRPADKPMTTWKKDQVGAKVRRIIAQVIGVEEKQVRPATACN